MNKYHYFSNKIAFIIPTRNRPAILNRLLKSFESQTILPDQIIIVDGSDAPKQAEIQPFINLNISYMRIFPPSLTKQRNEGLKALKDNISLVGYLDDDIVMEKDTVEEILNYWENCSEKMGGISFNITNSLPSKVTWYEKLFLLNGDRKGIVLKSGWCTRVYPLSKNVDNVQWLCGGATVWKRDIFKEFYFDEWYIGRPGWDDLDFSFSVSKKYKLSFQYSIKVQHLQPPSRMKNYNSFIKQHVITQYYFINKYKELSKFYFYWSIFGSIILLSLAGIIKLKKDNLSMAYGYLTGLLNVIRGKIQQSDEHFGE